MEARPIEIISVVGFFVGILGIVKIIADNLTRRRFLTSHLSDEAARELLASMRANGREDALKWGVVLMFMGTALILIDVLPITFADPVAYGLILLFGGVGLIVYRFVASSFERKP